MCSFRSLGWIHGIGPLWCSASRVSSVHQDPEPPGTSCSTPIMNSSHVRKSLYLQWATLESWNVKPALYYWTWVIYIDLVSFSLPSERSVNAEGSGGGGGGGGWPCLISQARSSLGQDEEELEQVCRLRGFFFVVWVQCSGLVHCQLLLPWAGRRRIGFNGLLN